MKDHGGNRVGAGRPKGSPNTKTLIEAEARTVFVGQLLKEWKPIIDTTLAVALGKIQMIEIKGKLKRVYTRPPDPRMLQMIIEMVIGRPKQPIDASVNLPELQQLATDIRSILTEH